MELLNNLKNLSVRDCDSNGQSLMTSFSASVGGVPTEIFISDYTTRLLIIISQFQNVGSMIEVKKEQVSENSGSQPSNNIYSTKVIFGVAGEETHVAARYLAEQLDIKNSLYLFISLKSYDIETVKACKDVILDLTKGCQTNQ